MSFKEKQDDNNVLQLYLVNVSDVDIDISGAQYLNP